jgi:hypothetical protein
MNLIQNLTRRLPSSQELEKIPVVGTISKQTERLAPRFAFFRRRIRLRRNSKIAVPLGVVLLFPLIVIILILIIFVRHPSGPGNFMVPAGAPPQIKYAICTLDCLNLADLMLEKSAKNMTRYLSQDALNRQQNTPEKMRRLWY